MRLARADKYTTRSGYVTVHPGMHRMLDLSMALREINVATGTLVSTLTEYPTREQWSSKLGRMHGWRGSQAL